MFRNFQKSVVAACLAMVSLIPLSVSATTEEDEAAYQAYMDFATLVSGGQVMPGWMPDGSQFWFAEGGPQNRVLYKVDPASNTKSELFEVARLREALTEAVGHEPAGMGVPFDQISFVGPTKVQFSLEGVSWILDLENYALSKQAAPNSFSISPYLISEAQRKCTNVFLQDRSFWSGRHDALRSGRS